MADNKANIMIAASSIVLSISISQADNLVYKLPLLIICVSSLVALMLAILAVLPTMSYPKDKQGKPNRHSPFFNLLYFGHFSRLPQQVFEQELEKMTQSDSKLYSTIAKDIYSHGQVLAQKKYFYLRWSYIAFLAGAAIAAFAFVINVILGMI